MQSRFYTAVHQDLWLLRMVAAAKMVYALQSCGKRHNEDLDQLGDHVQRIAHMGLHIHDELQGRNILLQKGLRRM